MIEYLILIFVAGVCFGYGLKTGIKNIVRSIRYHLWAFWNYKILGKPEPDPYETMMNSMLLALVVGSLLLFLFFLLINGSICLLKLVQRLGI